jgi:glycolate oxidase
MIAELKNLFDPDNRLNPGKVLPTGRGCLEIRQPPLAAGRAMY